MNLAPVVERLRSLAPLFKLVGSAAEYDAAADALAATPAAFVVELANTSRQQDSYTLSVVTQIVQVQVGVVIAVGLQQDVAGGADQAPLEAARVAARSALLGWQIDPENEPLTYLGGQLLDFQPGTLWWQEVYLTTQTITDR